MSCEICGHSDCHCKVFVLEEDQPSPAQSKEQTTADVLPLSGYEKALILGLREQTQITLNEPMEQSSILQGFVVNPAVEKQAFYCANCGLRLKSAENENFEFACDCAESGKKYNFPLITMDPNEHIRRTQLKND